MTNSTGVVLLAAWRESIFVSQGVKPYYTVSFSRAFLGEGTVSVMPRTIRGLRATP
jgi:hypothetical protein